MTFKWLIPLFFLILSYPLPSSGQDISHVIREAEQLEKNLREKDALQKFKEVLKLQPVHMYALAKCSELCSRIGHREKDHRVRDDYYKAAEIYAKTALKFFPQMDEPHVAMAIATGRVALTKSGKEKVALVKDIKMHAEEALRINRNNFKAWHILGKWNYEVCNLNMIERTAIKVFYGGLPVASLKASIDAYEKAKSLRPDFMLNYLELAKAYKKYNEKEKAISQLMTLLTLQIHTEDDPHIKDEASKLISKWK